mgnify:CR=1 FL=1
MELSQHHDMTLVLLAVGVCVFSAFSALNIASRARDASAGAAAGWTLFAAFALGGGMLPLVLMPGSGSELYRGLGSVVLGGLLVSTIFTLALVPTLFSLMLDAKQLATKTIRRTTRPPASS